MGCPDTKALLATTPTSSCPLCRDPMGFNGQIIRELLEYGRSTTGGVSERLSDEPVGEPGVSRQEWPVQVGADRTPHATTFESRLSVVPEPVEHPSERLGTWIETGLPGVVLESRDRPALTRLELTLEEHVADHSRGARDGLMGEEADARHQRTVTPSISTAEELISTTHGEQRGALVDGGLDRAALGDEVGCDECLLPILSASDVEEIVLRRPNLDSQPDALDLELVAPECCAALEHRDVAAIRVDIEVLRVQVCDADSQRGVSQ